LILLLASFPNWDIRAGEKIEAGKPAPFDGLIFSEEEAERLLKDLQLLNLRVKELQERLQLSKQIEEILFIELRESERREEESQRRWEEKRKLWAQERELLMEQIEKQRSLQDILQTENQELQAALRRAESGWKRAGIFLLGLLVGSYLHERLQ